MARTIAQIKQSIVDAKNADSNLAGLSSTSNVSEWNLWASIVAACQWTLETLFDLHVTEVNNIITTMKPHTLQWYVSMAKAFQFGDSLPDDSDTYTLIDATKQIVAYAAATEAENGLRIKAAKLASGALAKLADSEKTAFSAYMNLVKDAGVRLNITSDDPDRFVASLEIFYDPLVLDSSGARLDGTGNTPVQDAIVAFLDNLPFNGLFVINDFIAALRQVQGVRIVKPVSLQATYGSVPLSSINYEYLPDAGYMDINTTTDLTLTFTAHGPIN